MNMLKIEKPIPENALKQIEALEFIQNKRRCDVVISEEDAVTYVHPESFDFSDVYGTCELIQLKGYPPVISKFEFEKNCRSFEQEATKQSEEIVMKTYKEIIKKEKVPDQTYCNCCGEPAVQEESDEYHHRYWSCNTKIDYVVHGSFPGQHSGTMSYDICQKCFKEKIQPLMNHFPPNEEKHDCDSGQTTVTP